MVSPDRIVSRVDDVISVAIGRQVCRGTKTRTPEAVVVRIHVAIMVVVATDGNMGIDHESHVRGEILSPLEGGALKWSAPKNIRGNVRRRNVGLIVEI
jgi:hypothetical protein